jgi:hypothetical protein
MGVESKMELLRIESNALHAELPQVKERSEAAVQFIIEELGPDAAFTAANLTRANELLVEFDEIVPRISPNPDEFWAARKKELGL